MAAGGNARGKSGLPLARVPGNARRGQPQGKRHREETAPLFEKVRLRLGGVMVKRWGKSPPRTWRQGRHGKPHPEQCQIGASRGGRSGASRDTARRDANAREARVGSLTAVATRLAEEWSSMGFGPGQNPAYRLSAHVPPLSGGPLCAWFRGKGTGAVRGKTEEDHRRLYAERGAVCGGVAGPSPVGRL